MTRRPWPVLPAFAGGTGLLLTASVMAAVMDGPTPTAGSPAPAPTVSTTQPPEVVALGGAGSVVPLQIPAAPPAVAPSTGQQAQAKPAPAKPAQPAQPVGQSPGTVRLAKGGTATLVRRELGPDATLPVPSGLREATWWGAGLDATSGATVFAGHVDWHGQVGPFAELWDAGDGDRLSVVDTAGRTWSFRVSSVVTVAKTDLPRRAEELFGQTGKYRLVLVTCGGRWIGGSHGYESNRIVVATRD